ncbi:MAG TPA: DNA-processing protein DprA [Acidobacteriota bacterium]|nr:DNA-processing protein DprA [Acidobacteriota bacterium]
MGHTRAAARGDAEYPPRLAALLRPPERVFLEGPWDHDGPSVAIVGARSATGDGLDVARELAAALAGRGVAVLSGLARGIDAGGRTGAVLGTPLGRVYPRAHRALQERVARSLGLLSELPAGAAATKSTFATRNRLLAALSDAVILVQGRATSGALNTVRAAFHLGRPVGAVPWDPREEYGEAPLALLRSGRAELIRGADDAMELLGIFGATGATAASGGSVARREAGVAARDRAHSRPAFPIRAPRSTVGIRCSWTRRGSGGAARAGSSPSTSLGGARSSSGSGARAWSISSWRRAAYPPLPGFTR